jgi:hypothetical protein
MAPALIEALWDEVGIYCSQQTIKKCLPYPEKVNLVYFLHSQINLQVFPESKLTLTIGPCQVILEVKIGHFHNLIPHRWALAKSF